MLQEISLDGKNRTNHRGGTGIGFGIAEQFVESGAKVILTGRREEILQKAASRLGKAASYYTADLTDSNTIKEMVEKIERETPIDILVNNAGINLKGPFLTYREEDFDQVVAIQEKAVFLMTQAVASHMAVRRAGAIINITSLSARIGCHLIKLIPCARAGLQPLPAV